MLIINLLGLGYKSKNYFFYPLIGLKEPIFYKQHTGVCLSFSTSNEKAIRKRDVSSEYVFNYAEKRLYYKTFGKKPGYVYNEELTCEEIVLTEQQKILLEAFYSKINISYPSPFLFYISKQQVKLLNDVLGHTPLIRPLNLGFFSPFNKLFSTDPYNLDDQSGFINLLIAPLVIFSLGVLAEGILLAALLAEISILPLVLGFDFFNPFDWSFSTTRTLLNAITIITLIPLLYVPCATIIDSMCAMTCLITRSLGTLSKICTDIFSESDYKEQAISCTFII